MRQSRRKFCVCVYLLLFSFFISISISLNSYSFMLIHSKPTPYSSMVVPPTNQAPFVHWDLREFADCEIPYSVNPPAAPAGAVAAIDAAFAQWQGVSPAVIKFRNVGNTAQASFLRDDWNVLSWTAPPGNDGQVIGVGLAAAPGAVIVNAGPDGWLETHPVNDDVYDPGTNTIREPAVGGDGIANTPANNSPGLGGAGGALALACTFVNNATGKAFEFDVLFNHLRGWAVKLNQAALPAGFDIQTIAMHEIGHGIGLHHVAAGPDFDNPPLGNFAGAEDVDVDGDGVIDTPIMRPAFDATATQILYSDDENGCNYLYTPDLGDAPDPYRKIFNQYPSLVHWIDTASVSRILNGVCLYLPGKGAEHLFGYFPTYQYEWLGEAIDDHPAECESRQIDKDLFDDGVEFAGAFFAGMPTRVEIEISTSGLAGRYVSGMVNERLYLRGWFDWNGNGKWDIDELELWWEGGPGFTDAISPNWRRIYYDHDNDNLELDFDVTPPVLLFDVVWARFRLDYGEDCGLFGNIDGTLDNTEGAAQFGEVEDYRVLPIEWWIPPSFTAYDLIHLLNYGFTSLNLTLYNFETDTISGTLNSTDPWVQNIHPSYFNIPPSDSPQVVTFDIDASSYSDTFLVGNIVISQNQVRGESSYIPVHVLVSDSFVTPEFVVVSNPTFSLSESNTGNLGHFCDTAGFYLANDDVNLLLDGSPVLGFISPDDDTLVGRHIFDDFYVYPHQGLEPDTLPTLKTIVVQTEFWPVRIQIPPADQYWPWWRVKMKDYVFYSESPGNKNEQYLALKTLQLFHDEPPPWWVDVTPPGSIPPAYLGMLLDVVCPSDSGFCNYPGMDGSRRMAFLQGYGGDNEKYRMGITQRDTCFWAGDKYCCWPDPNTIVTDIPFAMHLVRNDASVYPAGGYDDDSLYIWMSTPGDSVHGDGNPADYSLLTTGRVISAHSYPSSDTHRVAYALVASDELDIYKMEATVDMIMCGNVNRDLTVSISDVVYFVNYLFRAGPEIWIYMGDANADGYVTVSDVVYLINYLFRSGPPPQCSSL